MLHVGKAKLPLNRLSLLADSIFAAQQEIRLSVGAAVMKLSSDFRDCIAFACDPMS